MKTEERGALIVEATIVFPVMFFIILFLIYFGNVFYLRSQVDAIVAESAIKAASYCVDPLMAKVEGGTVPTTMEDVQPYHSIFGSAQTDSVREEMVNKLNRIGTGYFAGMNLRNIVVDQFKYNRGLVTSTFSVDVSYRIQFPIRFMGSDRPTVLKIHSQTTVPVTDTPEFIQNVDMAMDFFDSSGMSEKLSKMVLQVKKFFGK